MGRKKPRVKEREEKAGRERQIWIRTHRGNVVCDSLSAAALHASREAGIPVSEWQVLAALRLGFSLCGMRYSYTKPEAGDGKRPPLLRRNRLEEGIRRIY
jgi:hypothetical protein